MYAPAMAIGSAIFVALALGLVVLALRGRRVDDHPVCRGCGFDLSGIDESAPCPECGRGLTGRRAVRVGNRRRRALPIIGALALLVFALGATGTLIWSRSTSFDWNTVKPAWLLIRDSASGSQERSDGAIHELMARMALGSISQAATARAIDAALDVHADQSITWQPVRGELIEEAYILGLVTDEQWARYADQSALIDFSVRTRIHEGDQLPIRARVRSRSGPRGPRTNARIDLGPLSVDGRQLEPALATRTMSTGIMHDGGTSTMTSRFDLMRPGAGRVQIEIPVRTEIFDLASRGGASLVVREEVIRETIEIVDRSAPLISMMAPDGQAAPTVELESSPAGVRMRLTSRDLKLPICARIFVLEADEEVEIGTIVHQGGTGRHQQRVHSDVKLEPGMYDVVLRPDPSLATRLVGIDRIWGEEIILRHVPLE